MDFMRRGEDNRGNRTHTLRLDTTASGPSMPSPPSSPQFYAATLPIYPGLGQAPNLVHFIPGGLIP